MVIEKGVCSSQISKGVSHPHSLTCHRREGEDTRKQQSRSGGRGTWELWFPQKEAVDTEAE